MIGIDTNVLVYSVDADQTAKQPIAIQLLDQLLQSATSTVIPWQVAAEYLNRLRRWQNLSKIRGDDVLLHFQKVLAAFPIVYPSAAVLPNCFRLHDRYSLSHWDAML